MNHIPDQENPRTLGRAVRGAGKLGLDAAGLAFGLANRAIAAPLHTTRRLIPRLSGGDRRPPGSSPGIEQLDHDASESDARHVPIQWTRFHADALEDDRASVDDLPDLLDQLKRAARHRADAAPQDDADADDPTTHWVTVRGLNPWLVDQFRQALDLHTLAAEDVLVVPQLPKVEPFGSQLFLVARLVAPHEGHAHAQQISIFVLGRCVLVFQETPDDPFSGVRQRLHAAIPRLRGGGPGYLLYALLDAIVDHGYPLLEQISNRLETLEQPILERPTPDTLRDVHQLRRELTLIRRIIWPTRQMIETLRRDDADILDESTRTFLRDVHDHAAQLLSIVEAQREVAGGMADLYLSAVSNRMNEAMRVLAVIATLFIPTSFLAGVYGMNFDRLPGAGAAWGFWVFLAVCLAIVSSLLALFRRKQWI